MTTDMEWGYNCLTSGIHHGRPEQIWNLPLLYAATVMFSRDQLKELVISRIYNDAMQYVGLSENPRFATKEWADRIKELAAEKYLHTLQHKVGELSNYYKSDSWKSDAEGAIISAAQNKLNPYFEPLHGHDSINLLCRIIGVSAEHQARQEMGI